MQDNAFTPFGPTYAVTGSAVQVLASVNIGQSTSYRVRNLSSAAAYFVWSPALSPTSTVAPSTITGTAPVINSPQANTIGMLATSVETFCLPSRAWFLALAGGTFEVTPGEGL